MLYFANPRGDAAKAAMLNLDIGFIDTPAQGNKRPGEVFWCADNGCFGAGWPGYERWLAWLAKHAHEASTCLFATAPDVVGDAAATLERSAPWLPKIRELGYQAALVAQNGLEDLDVPWDSFDVLFLGGSAECLGCAYVRPVAEYKRKTCPHCDAKLTEWKLGAAARELVAEAKRRGKWVHMGRVNSWKRISYADEIGCDSTDGTYLVFGKTGENLPKLLGWLDALNNQQALDLAA
jgi:hypothetical protein